MSILISGIDMPRLGMVINIYADGRVTNHYDEQFETIATAVTVPPHGRLVDADALMERIDAEWNGRTAFRAATIVEYINDTPTIIPEDEPAKDTNVPSKPYDLLYEEGGPDA